MKKTIIRFLVFMFPIFLAWGFLEFFYRTVPNNYTLKYEQIEKKANGIEVLLFGSSHCFYGLNPAFFSSKAFNFSGISQTLYFDKLLLEAYIDKLPKLKKVVFCIEYTNLSQADNTWDDVFRKYYYADYMNLEVPLVSPWDPKKYSLAFTRNLEASIGQVEKYCKNGTLVNCDENGWGNDYRKADRIPPAEIAKIRAKAHEDGSVDFSINKKRIDYLIALCRKKNIEFIIVSLPQTQSYSENLNQEKLHLIFDTCRGFELQNKGHVRYLNLFNDKYFKDEDFYDADHLNEVGAEKCSRWVNAFLENCR